MARVRFTRNSAGIAEILKTVDFGTEALAEQVAAAAGGEVEHYVTDRRASSVRVPAAEQARNGALTRGAASAGLTVRTKR